MYLTLAIAWILVGVLSWGWFNYLLNSWLGIATPRDWQWLSVVGLIVGVISGPIALGATIFVPRVNGFKLRAGLRFL